MRASDESGHGNLHDPRIAQKLRALAGGNPLRQPLHDPGLADAIVLVDDATNPMLDAGQSLLRSATHSGHESKLAIVGIAHQVWIMIL